MNRPVSAIGRFEGATESMVEALFQSAGVLAGIFELDESDYRYVLANANTAAFYGRTVEEIVGASGADLGLPTDQIAGRMTFLWHCWRGGAPLTTEYPFTHGDQSGWFLGTFAPVVGKTPQVSFILVDISARKQAELAAERERRRLATALDATGLGLWEYDLAQNQVLWDQRTCSLFGVASDTSIDLDLYGSLLHPDDRERVFAAYRAALGGEAQGRYSVEHRTAPVEGVSRWLRGTGQVVFDAIGQPTRVFGTALDITAEVEARERQQLLMGELNHRVKNNLATVQSLALQTARGAPDLRSFLQSYQGRLLALSRTHDVLTANAWTAADLLAVAREELEPLGERAHVEGPSIRLSAPKALAMGMILHELATNAAKHGALSAPTGQVKVSWRLDPARTVHLRWSEHGGPAPAVTRTPGFGMRLVEKLTTGDLQGAADYQFADGGLRFEIVFPAGEVSD